MNAGTLTPKEFSEAVKRCRPWVIAGLVVLILLLLPPIVEHIGNRVTPRAKKAGAQSTAVTIVNVIDQYHTDYDFLPAPTSRVKGHDVDTDSSAEEGLILILNGMDATANSRRTDYLGDVKDAKSMKDGKRLDGLVRDGEAISLVDPWGHPYLIRLDGDGDGYVEDPSKPGSMLKRKAIVWSAGKDGDPATWNDNVASWMSGE